MLSFQNIYMCVSSCILCVVLSDTQDPEARKTLIGDLHKLKTDLFMQLVETGAMPLRPGVKRLVQEAMAAGVCVYV